MMRIYECTLYTRRRPFHEPEPVMIEGSQVAREFAAETASKARYQFYLDLCDAWGDKNVRFQDIRVRSLSRTASKRPVAPGWQQRVEVVNAIIRVIGSHGRRFLSENSDRRTMVDNPFFAHFTVDDRFEIWYADRYSRKPILVRHNEWPGFSDGGTLRDLVKHLAYHIETGEPINERHFGPFPSWSCNGDPWGYGLNEMEKVRAGVNRVIRPEGVAA